MSRELEFEPDLICEICGAKGAYDVYGDNICPKCMSKECEGQDRK